LHLKIGTGSFLFFASAPDKSFLFFWRLPPSPFSHSPFASWMVIA
jgi:hypothetical protein